MHLTHNLFRILACIVKNDARHNALRVLPLALIRAVLWLPMQILFWVGLILSIPAIISVLLNNIWWKRWVKLESQIYGEIMYKHNQCSNQEA